MASIAAAAQIEDVPALVDNALDLPEIVHPPGRSPETRPPLATRATPLVSNAPPAATQGSEL
jgi:hypothetical protein